MGQTCVAIKKVFDPLRFYELHDINQMGMTQSYRELTPIGLRVLNRIPGDVVMVCGPISTGGAGSMTENMRVFHDAIERVVQMGEHVFTQLPFEGAMQNIKGKLLPESDGLSLLELFYRPLFESGMIKRLYFIPGWEGSFGATWEHTVALELGIKIQYL